jgi:hypothetical protein
MGEAGVRFSAGLNNAPARSPGSGRAMEIGALRKRDPSGVGALGSDIGNRTDGLAADRARAGLGSRALWVLGAATRISRVRTK